MDSLEKLRQQIDDCDQILVQTFEKRMEIVLQILEYKREKGLPIFHPKREEKVIENVLLKLKDKSFSREIKALYDEIFRLSRHLQSRELFPYNIVLIGFMGTGKSTVGNYLAQFLGMEVLDTDQMIEERIGMDISSIFEQYGEGFFRELEKTAVKEGARRDNVIISCGGGVVLRAENIQKLREKGRVVLLTAQPETLYNRLKDDSTRPLLKNGVDVASIDERLKQRQELYQMAADIVIQTDGKSIESIGKEVIQELLKQEK